MTELSNTATIVEVGPRDGLQNESNPISLQDRLTLIDKLVAAGVQHIESGSFVNPKWVPQMAGSDALFSALNQKAGVSYSALVPNMKGYQRAIDVGVKEVAVFAAASETFSQKNTNCSISESLDRFAPVMEYAAKAEVKVRGYVSCIAGCPYEGDVDVGVVADIASRLRAMGCYEISLGDTIGTGTPGHITRLLHTVIEQVPANALAVHCHDTYGQALANIYAALLMGVNVIDSSVAGLGGCPYARGASGNVASEDVVYMLQGLGIETGIDLKALIEAGRFISNCLDRESQSHVARALSRA